VLYESKEARDTACRSGMEHGMAASYNRLEELLTNYDGAVTPSIIFASLPACSSVVSV